MPRKPKSRLTSCKDRVMKKGVRKKIYDKRADRKSKIWNYFIELRENGKKKGICNFCGRKCSPVPVNLSHHVTSCDFCPTEAKEIAREHVRQIAAKCNERLNAQMKAKMDAQIEVNTEVETCVTERVNEQMKAKMDAQIEVNTEVETCVTERLNAKMDAQIEVNTEVEKFVSEIKIEDSKITSPTTASTPQVNNDVVTQSDMFFVETVVEGCEKLLLKKKLNFKRVILELLEKYLCGDT